MIHHVSPSNMKKAVLFDLDGTLLDTIDDLYVSTNYALRTVRLPERTRQEVMQFVGNGVRKLIERAVPADISQQQFETVLQIFSRYYKQHSMVHTRPYDGIIPMLQSLKSMGYLIAVISNKMHEAVGPLCDTFFPNLLDTCIGTSSQHRVKPAPDMIHAVLQRFDMTSQQAVYVGDSEVDIATAQTAQIPCISVTWGFRTRAFLYNNGAKIIAETPQSVVNILSAL